MNKLTSSIEKKMNEIISESLKEEGSLETIKDGLSTIEEINSKINNIEMKIENIENKIIQEKLLEAKNDLASQLFFHFNKLNSTVNIITKNKRFFKKRVRCLFLVHNISTWESLCSVYNLMLEDKLFEPIIATINKRFPGDDNYDGENELSEKLSLLGFAHIRMNSEDSFLDLEIIKLMAPDFIFRQSQWDNDIPPGFSTENLNFSHLLFIPYEIMNFLDVVDHNIENSFFHKSCSMIFLANEQTKMEVIKKYPFASNLYVCGHPKVETLGKSLPYWPISSAANNNSYKVLWAAHHSIGEDWSNFGTFLSIYESMLEFAKMNSDIDVVFSPHPALFSTLKNEKYTEVAEKVQNWLEEWNNLQNTSYTESSTYGGLFAASDLLLVDGISWLLEYQLTNKPIIFLERDDHLPLLESGETIAKGTYRCRKIEDGLKRIVELKNGAIDYLSEQREKTISTLLSEKEPSRKIIETIKDTFNLD